MRSFYNKKLFYTEKRGQIFYVVFKNPETGKKLTAKSTGKTNRQEAELQAYKWLSEGVPDPKTEKSRDIVELFDIDTFLYRLKNTDFSQDDIKEPLINY